MSEENNKTESENKKSEEQAAAPRFAMRTQYIKDLSFENPNAPGILFAVQEAPKVDLNIELSARAVKDNMFELTMTFNVKTSIDGSTMFIAELSYGGLFEMDNIPEDRLEQVMMVDCAFMLFPFARRALADVTRDGGYPPLQLDPVDFVAMYVQNKKAA